MGSGVWTARPTLMSVRPRMPSESCCFHYCVMLRPSLLRKGNWFGRFSNFSGCEIAETRKGRALFPAVDLIGNTDGVEWIPQAETLAQGGQRGQRFAGAGLGIVGAVECCLDEPVGRRLMQGRCYCQDLPCMQTRMDVAQQMAPFREPPNP